MNSAIELAKSLNDDNVKLRIELESVRAELWSVRAENKEVRSQLEAMERDKMELKRILDTEEGIVDENDILGRDKSEQVKNEKREEINRRQRENRSINSIRCSCCGGKTSNITNRKEKHEMSARHQKFANRSK